MVQLSDKPSRKSTKKTYQEHPGTVPEIYPFFYPAPGVPPEGCPLRTIAWISWKMRRSTSRRAASDGCCRKLFQWLRCSGGMGLQREVGGWQKEANILTRCHGIMEIWRYLIDA